MPRAYRRKYRKRSYKRSYKRSKMFRGKRKAAKAERQSESFDICQDIETSLQATGAPSVTAISAYQWLFQSDQFTRMKQAYDQFKLNSIKVNLVFHSPKSTTEFPLTVETCVDRNGFTGDENIFSYRTYGSYKYQVSGVSNKVYTNIYVSGTTLMEKSTYYPTSMAGVDANDRLSNVSIPLHRNVFFPWNPNIGVGYYIPGYGNNIASVKLRGKVTLNVTFRGLRTIDNEHDVGDDNVQLHAGGEVPEDYNTYDTNTYEVRIRPPTSVFDKPLKPVQSYTFTNDGLFAGLKELVVKQIVYPQFNTVVDYVKNIVTDLGRTYYEAWCNRVIQTCQQTLTSVLTSLASYGIEKITSQYDSFTGSLLGINSGTTYYFTDDTASSGVPELPDSTSLSSSTYFASFSIGTQLLNFLKTSAISLFNTANVINDACDLYLYKSTYPLTVANMRSMLSGNLRGKTLCSWTQVAVSGGSFSIPIGGIELLHFPHANYWITGFIYNNNYTGSASSDTRAAFPFNLSDVYNVTCVDGLPLINMAVSDGKIYTTTLKSADAYDSNNLLTYSLSTNSTSTSSVINEESFYNGTIPIDIIVSGYGCTSKTGFYYPIKDFGFVCPIFISKYKMFH